jgi:hypothetical protein
MKKEKENKVPSASYDFLVKNGMDEIVALEIDEYTQQKEKRKKRLEKKSKKEEKWK